MIRPPSASEARGWVASHRHLRPGTPVAVVLGAQGTMFTPMEAERLSGFVSGQAKSLVGDLYEYQAAWTLDARMGQWSAVVSYNGLSKAVPTGQVSLTSRNLAGGIQGAVRTRVEELIGTLDIPTRPAPCPP